MTTIIYSELLLFDMPIHGWILNFGIFMVLMGLVYAIAISEWMWGTLKWHRHLIKRSFANRVLLTLRENAGGKFFKAIPSCLEMEG
jgi:hypothetical protein